MDGWKTSAIVFEGGLIENIPQIQQGVSLPGSAIRSINFEPYQGSGIRRINGYTKFDDDEVPGTGNILGVFVYGSQVLACREDKIFISAGSGWTEIDDTRTGAGRYRAAKYSFVSPTIMLVDGTNYPIKYSTPTATEINDPAVLGASDIAVFKSHLFFAVNNLLVFSSPNTDDDFDTVNGAGVINVGHPIEALYPWRDNLYVFCRDKIFRLVGNVFGSGGDAQFLPVTANIGCISRFSIQEIGGDIFFLGPDGIRTIAGTAKIGDVELEAYTRPIFKTMKAFTDRFNSGQYSSLAIRSKSQYRLFGASDSDAPEGALGLVGGLRIGEEGLSVNWGELRGIKVCAADSGYNNDNEILVHASHEGYVYRHDDGNTFDGTPIYFYYQTPYQPMDDPEVRKVLYKISLYIDADGTYQYNFRHNFDYGSDDIMQPNGFVFSDAAASVSYYNTPGTTYGSGAKYFTGIFRLNRFNLEGSGFTVSYIISGDEPSAPFILKSINIQYNLGDRR